MTPPAQSDPSQRRPAPRIPDRLVPFLMAIMVTLLTYLLVQEIRVVPVWHPVLFGGIAILTLLEQRWVIYIALGLALFTRLQGGAAPLSVSSLYFTIVLIGYTTFSFRYTDLSSVYGPLLRKPGDARPANGKPSGPWLRLHPFAAGWVWLPVAVVLSIFILWMFPLDLTTDERLAITPAGMRAIGIVWFLSFLWFGLECLGGLVARQHTNPLRARVFARSLFCKSLKSELGGIEKRRGKRVRNRETGY